MNAVFLLRPVSRDPLTETRKHANDDLERIPPLFRFSPEDFTNFTVHFMVPPLGTLFVYACTEELSFIHYELPGPLGELEDRYWARDIPQYILGPQHFLCPIFFFPPPSPFWCPVLRVISSAAGRGPRPQLFTFPCFLAVRIHRDTAWDPAQRYSLLTRAKKLFLPDNALATPSYGCFVFGFLFLCFSGPDHWAVWVFCAFWRSWLLRSLSLPLFFFAPRPELLTSLFTSFAWRIARPPGWISLQPPHQSFLHQKDLF